MISGEWVCSLSSADRRCANHIWVINNLIAHWNASYIKDLTVIVHSNEGTMEKDKCNYLVHSIVLCYNKGISIMTHKIWSCKASFRWQNKDIGLSLLLSTVYRTLQRLVDILLIVPSCGFIRLMSVRLTNINERRGWKYVVIYTPFNSKVQYYSYMECVMFRLERMWCFADERNDVIVLMPYSHNVVVGNTSLWIDLKIELPR